MAASGIARDARHPRRLYRQRVFTPLPAFGDTFELRITLRHIEPAIWRVVRLPVDLSLATLHEVLQVTFGWKNCHLHDFTIGGIRFAENDDDDELFAVDEHAAPLGAIARAGSTFLYRYDYGDDWEHDVVVERVEHGAERAIQCTDGARACPPEDCGGPPGYARMLAVLENPMDEEHADMKRWAPRGFDAAKFDVAATTKRLNALAKRVLRLRAQAARGFASRPR